MTIEITKSLIKEADDIKIDGNLIDGNKAKFLVDEYSKTLNLFDVTHITYNNATSSYSNNAITVTGNGSSTYQNISCRIYGAEKGKTYTLSFGSISYTGNARPIVGMYDGTDFLMPTQISSNWSYTFTYSSSATTELRVTLYARWGSMGGNGGNVTFGNPMLNEGTTALPYQAYNGKVIHQVNIEPTWLWTNPNPTSDFNEQTIIIDNLSNYKYLVVEFKLYKTFTGTPKLEKFKNEIGTHYGTLNCGDDTFYGRKFYVISSNEVKFSKAYRGSTTIVDYVIPLAIYGTNIL